jgi:hypothetical protein
METNHEDRWVANLLAALEPEWSSNLARGRELLRARLTGPRHSSKWVAMAFAAAAVCVTVLALPGTRALAEELWYRFVLNRVEVVRLDLSKLPLHMQVTTNGLEQNVQNVHEAEGIVGFTPYLPLPEVLSANPGFTIIGPITVEQTIRVRDLESALGKEGAGDARVPAEWEGVQLRTEIGPAVAANYPDDVHILQTRPIELSIPSGFALEHFAGLEFRSIGVSWWEARAMAQRFAAHPAWLLDIPPEAMLDVQEVALRAGPALLIENLNEKSMVQRATVIFSTSQRTYSVSSRSRKRSLEIANALP